MLTTILYTSHLHSDLLQYGSDEQVQRALRLFRFLRDAKRGIIPLA